MIARPELTFARLAGADVALVPIANHDARAIVDATDAPRVAGRAWRLHPDGYAITNSRDTTVKMHALLLPVATPLTVDHINRNPLDNRRSNLRPATRAQQQHNRGLPRSNRSGYDDAALEAWGEFARINFESVV